MLDLSHIPNSQQDVQIFYANQGNFGYQTWRKPRKCNFVYILSIDGGGGGSSGYSAPITGGAGTFGGASGSVTRALINSSFVPDSLYVKVGKGGVGGASATGGALGINSGTTGESSGVFCLPNVSSQGTLNQASSFLGGANAANGGSAVAATGTPASVLSNNFLIGLTNFISLVGTNSVAGSIGPLVSNIVTAGCNGGNYSGAATPVGGAGISSSYNQFLIPISPLIQGGTGGGLVGGNGADGITFWKPFFSLGGAGGGNSYTAGGVAGNGGNGGIGSGGGAGGTSNTGTSGKGGNGGDGIVIIISF